MEEDPTTIEPTHDRVILAVTDINNNDTHDNSTLSNKQKQKQDIPQTQMRKAKGNRSIQDTKGSTQHGGIHPEETAQ